MSLESDVRAIVIDQLGVEESEVKAESRFIEDLGADSLDTVELVMALEEKFDVSIPDSDAEKVKTVQNAIDYIKEHKV